MVDTRFDPQALTSLTRSGPLPVGVEKRFRSTGSYEPDPLYSTDIVPVPVFRSTGSYEPDHPKR